MQNKASHFFKTKTPFLIITDFLGERVELLSLPQAKEKGIEFEINTQLTPSQENLNLEKEILSFNTYAHKIDTIKQYIKDGETYLLNLTCKNKIHTPLNLNEIFKKAKARYKLKYQDKFVCFSPECFVQIQNNTISTFPMKGTIDASLPKAKERIINDAKELAEHTMAVDLLRNDLGIVSKNVKVKRFRYLDTINAGKKELLQVSSEIVGELEDNWQDNFLSLFTQLLPAGSISGTPKKRTVEIIQTLEGFKREYFTGVFGYFDGEKFDSAVMIRFIEKEGNTLYYKSGGGITLDSNTQNEYQEMIDKIYIPS